MEVKTASHEVETVWKSYVLLGAHYVMGFWFCSKVHHILLKRQIQCITNLVKPLQRPPVRPLLAWISYQSETHLSQLFFSDFLYKQYQKLLVLTLLCILSVQEESPTCLARRFCEEKERICRIEKIWVKVITDNNELLGQNVSRCSVALLTLLTQPYTSTKIPQHELFFLWDLIFWSKK